MRFSLVLSLMPLAGFVGALHVTQPAKGDEVKASDSLTVKWTYVDTDAKSFNLYLVNNAIYPPVSDKIATNVKTSDGTYTIDHLSGIAAGSGYQINLQSDETLNTGILAQSEQFNVTGSAQSSSSSSSSSSSTSSSTSSSSTSSSATTGSATTTNTLTTSTTATGTATGSKTTGTAGSTGAAASGTSSQTAVPSTGAAAALVAHPAAAAGILAGALAFTL